MAIDLDSSTNLTGKTITASSGSSGNGKTSNRLKSFLMEEYQLYFKESKVMKEANQSYLSSYHNKVVNQRGVKNEVPSKSLKNKVVNQKQPLANITSLILNNIKQVKNKIARNKTEDKIKEDSEVGLKPYSVCITQEPKM